MLESLYFVSPSVKERRLSGTAWTLYCTLHEQLGACSMLVTSSGQKNNFLCILWKVACLEACTLHQQVMQLLAPSACLFSLCCLFVAAPAERFLFLGLTRKLCHLPIWRSVCFCAPVVQTSIQIDGEKPRGSFCSIAPSRNTYALDCECICHSSFDQDFSVITCSHLSALRTCCSYKCTRPTLYHFWGCSLLPFLHSVFLEAFHIMFLF